MPRSTAVLPSTTTSKKWATPPAFSTAEELREEVTRAVGMRSCFSCSSSSRVSGNTRTPSRSSTSSKKPCLRSASAETVSSPPSSGTLSPREAKNERTPSSRGRPSTNCR